MSDTKLTKLQGSDNYPIWKWKIGTILKEQGLYNTIMTEENIINDEKSKAMAVIFTASSETIIPLILNSIIPAEGWTILPEHFENNAANSDVLLRCQLHTYHFQEGWDVAVCLTEIEVLIPRLKTALHEISEKIMFI